MIKKTKRNVLVVVDMQAKFPASLDRSTIAAVKREIRRSISREDLIVVLEYECYGSTHKSLTNLVASYDLAETVSKNYDDGSDRVGYAVSLRQIEPVAFYICGVNRAACVGKTAFNLAERFPNSVVNLIDDACNQPEELFWAWERNPYFSPIKPQANMHIVDDNRQTICDCMSQWEAAMEQVVQTKVTEHLISVP